MNLTFCVTIMGITDAADPAHEEAFHGHYSSTSADRAIEDAIGHAIAQGVPLGHYEAVAVEVRAVLHPAQVQTYEVARRALGDAIQPAPSDHLH